MKKMNKPEVEAVRFDSNDVIATSGGGGGGGIGDNIYFSNIGNSNPDDNKIQIGGDYFDLNSANESSIVGALKSAYGIDEGPSSAGYYWFQPNNVNSWSLSELIALFATDPTEYQNRGFNDGTFVYQGPNNGKYYWRNNNANAQGN